MKKQFKILVNSLLLLISGHIAANNSTSLEQKITINWGLSARQGKRKTMEDFHVTGFKSDQRTNDTKNIFFGLYDGHGGSAAARITACGYGGYHVDDIFFRPLHAKILEPTNTKTELFNNYHAAYAYMDEIIQQHKNTSGTTVLTAHITWQYGSPLLVISWLGDSRAVLIDNNGSVVAATQDHKPSAPNEFKRIQKEGGFVSMPGCFPPYAGCSRVGGILAVSRALGDKDIKNQVKGISAEPSIISLPLAPNHKALIMACDGVWDVLSNQEASQIVHQALNENKQLTSDSVAEEQLIEDGSSDRLTLTARALRDAAYQRGSTDNISVIVIELQ